MLLRFCLVPQNLRKLPLRGEMKRDRGEWSTTGHWAVTTGAGTREWYSVFTHRYRSRVVCLPVAGPGPNVRSVRCCGTDWLSRVYSSGARGLSYTYHDYCLPLHLQPTTPQPVGIGRHYLSCGRPYHCRLAAMLPATDNATTTLEYTTPKYPIRSDTAY